MNEPRYKVIADSQSAHCCFTHTVVDTTRPAGQCAAGEFESVCECFCEADAERIAAALNAAAPMNDLQQALRELEQRNGAARHMGDVQDAILDFMVKARHTDGGVK